MKIFAHRGLHETYIENTMPAFKMALENGFAGIEMDLITTADKNIVICHDDDLNRLFGKNIKISQSQWQDIRELGIPSFLKVKTELFGKCELHLEIKSPGCAKQLIDQFGSAFEQEITPQVYITSFLHDEIKQFKQAFPGIATGALFRNDSMWQITDTYLTSLGVSAVCLPLSNTNSSLVHTIKSWGFNVFIFGVHTKRDFSKARYWYADLVYSDLPLSDIRSL